MWGKKRRCSVFIFVFLVVFLVAAKPAAAKTQQGKCGPKAKWSYNKKTKTVTISGKGAVTKLIQIKVENTKVKKIVVKEGITNLKKLEIHVKDIYSYEEYNDYQMQLVLPDSLKRIGWIGADIVKGLVTRGNFDMSKYTLTIPKNVSKINSAALANIRPRKVVVDPENKSFVCRDGVLFSKDMKTLVYYPPEKKQKTYKIPAGVRKIKALSFYGNRYLKKVVLPKKLKVIGSGAFCGCRKLSSVNLQQTKIKKLTDYTFFHDWGYSSTPMFDEEDRSVSMEESEELYKQLNMYKRSMPEYYGTFEGTNLQSIRLPDTLKYASSNTFLLAYVNDTSKKSPITLHLGKNFTGKINSDTKGYQGEKSLNLSGVSVAKVTVDSANTKYCVKNQALYSKDGKTLYQHFVSDSRKTYVIDAGTKRIAPGAFTWGDSIVDLIVEGSLDNIGYCAFSEFYSYPNNVESLGYGEYKNSLQHVKVQGSIQRIDAMAFRNSRLVTFECGGEIQCIGQRAFEGCNFLSSIPLNKGLKTIGGYAFRFCYKLQFSFSNNLEYIGAQAFSLCESVKELYFPDTVSYIDEYAFSGCKNLETISVPGDLLARAALMRGVFDGCESLKNIIFRKEGNG